MAEYQSFVDALPPDGAVVLVTDTWQGDRELHFDANWFKLNNPRLLEPRTRIHLWYPERMGWKLAPNQPTPPTDAELWGESNCTATAPASENNDLGSK